VSRRNLDKLLNPRTIAVIGASDRPHSVGAVVIRNLLKGRFRGSIWPVNRSHASVAGRSAYASVRDLPAAPELAIICTPARTVPGLVHELSQMGTRAAAVLSAGLDEKDAQERTFTAAMLEAAKPSVFRILGPNCVGLLLPNLGINASFAHMDALPGDLAFVTQSGALTTALLDWANTKQIGFSHFLSLGNSADVDFGDLLDYLGDDPGTRAILLYVESIRNARKFMSAARAAARNKPVIVVKAGRAPEGARAATSHTGALAGSDDVYEAAFRRAGMLRVKTTRELFEAAETLAHLKEIGGERLAIVSNGGGPAVMATDALIEGGGRLAALTPASQQRLDQLLPRGWSHGNPIDIIGDAPQERYVAALDTALNDPEVDAVLLLYAPTAIVDATDVAQACAPLIREASKPVLTCWMGHESVARARATCTESGAPTYSTPEEAIGGFLQVVQYERNQRQLLEVPSSLPDSFEPDREAARAILDRALADGQRLLSEHQAKQLLATYGIPVAQTTIVRDVDELQRAAADVGYPVALKILSPDITHKSDVGGVALNIGTPAELETAAADMLGRCRARCPSARLEGFTVQPMIRREGGIELIGGIAVDPTFGPVVLFGQGGISVEVVADKAVALPPLNAMLARELISRTRVDRLLAGYRNRPAVNRQALEQTLVRMSQLAVDLAEIVELDINPILADERGVLALDARVRIEPAAMKSIERLAIRPYPAELEEWAEFDTHKVRLRPIRPEDYSQHRAFLARVTPEDLRNRVFHAVAEVSRRDLSNLTQIDYEREMAFIAERPDEYGVCDTLGVVRAHFDSDNTSAEFGVLVRSDMQGRGLGELLVRKLMGYCQSRGVTRVAGDVLASNECMLRLAQRCGFRRGPVVEGTVRVTCDFSPESGAAPGELPGQLARQVRKVPTPERRRAASTY
jgi:acetyltransferase